MVCLPEAVRLIDLHVPLPRHQVAMLEIFAERDQTTVSGVLARQLDGVASAYADELSWAVGRVAWTIREERGGPRPFGS